MSHREDVLAAIEHRTPSRVPIDLGATPSSGISAIAYGNLKRHCGLSEGSTRIYDVVQQLAQPEDAVLDRFNIAAVDFGRTFNGRDEDWYDVTVADGQTAQYPAWFRPEEQEDGSWAAKDAEGEELARMPKGGWFFDQTCYPYLDAYPDNFSELPKAMCKVLWSAYAHSPWDHAKEPDFWTQLRTRTKALRESTDRAILAVCGCNLFEWGTFLRRFDQFCADLYEEPEKVEAMLDALMEIHLATLAKVCETVGDLVDILRFGDDLGMNSGPFISPKTYQQFFKPRHTKLCEYVHQNSPMKTYLHSCGSIHMLMPDLIEAGFDVINPVQTSCKDMEPDRLKREFGRDICFWGGGCDTQKVLPRGTPEEVRKHVLERLEIFAPDGGFVFNTVHNILPEVPPENIVAMYEAIEEFNGAG